MREVACMKSLQNYSNIYVMSVTVSVKRITHVLPEYINVRVFLSAKVNAGK